MNTLIKWPGGKKSEIKYIKTLIPSKYDRYVEPFFGGGALFFHLEPKNAYINDKCEELILFYTFISDKKYRKDFEIEIRKYVKYWNKIDNFSNLFEDKLFDYYFQFKENIIDETEFKKLVITLIAQKEFLLNDYFDKDFLILPSNFLNELKKGVVSKLKRTIDLDKKHNFSRNEIRKNMETGFRSSFYIHFRDIMNKAKDNIIKISDAKRIANYYFVREFCYGSMFRYNSKGEFNIPYGGMSYNTKNFTEKVDKIFSEDTIKLLSKTKIENLDFEEFLQKYDFSENDFIFLDPPYDTNFCDYEANNFSKEDHKRLAMCLYTIKAKFILIIKNTEFIFNLYNNKKDISVDYFNKNYTYNVKGRNERGVQHLLVHNLSDSQKNLLDY